MYIDRVTITKNSLGKNFFFGMKRDKFEIINRGKRRKKLQIRWEEEEKVAKCIRNEENCTGDWCNTKTLPACVIVFFYANLAPKWLKNSAAKCWKTLNNQLDLFIFNFAMSCPNLERQEIIKILIKKKFCAFFTPNTARMSRHWG